MRKCENCGANLDSGERCDCERDREKLDRAIGMITDAISTLRMADRLLRECGIVPCANLDYNIDILDRGYGRHIQLLSGREAFEHITGEKWKEEQEPVVKKWKRAVTIYRGIKITELQAADAVRWAAYGHRRGEAAGDGAEHGAHGGDGQDAQEEIP